MKRSIFSVGQYDPSLKKVNGFLLILALRVYNKFSLANKILLLNAAKTLFLRET